MTRLFLKCCLVLASLVSYGYAFVQPTTARNVYSARMNDNNMEVYKEVSTLSLRVNDNDDEVNVNLIPDVDAFTLTAVGFGLIAFSKSMHYMLYLFCQQQQILTHIQHFHLPFQTFLY